MGSNYYGNDQSGLSSSSSSSPSSSRKGKKQSSDKPKQPQRGLGVAQLEKIRLQCQLECNYLPSVHTPYTNPSFIQESMRMQTSYSSPPSSFSYCSSSPPFYELQTNPSHVAQMGLPDLYRTNIRHGDSQNSSDARLHPGNPSMGSQHYVEPNMTRTFFDPGVKGSLVKANKKLGNDSLDSSSQNSKCESSQEIDLELRLSL